MLSACAAGPDFERPAAPDVVSVIKEPLPLQTAASPTAGGGAQTISVDNAIPAEWWHLFRSTALDTLVEQSLRDNPDLESAQAALRQAMENVRAQIGAYYPKVAAGAGAVHVKDASQLSRTLASPVLLFNLYQAQLGVSWTPDLFGANRRQVEALQAQANAQRLQLEAARLALAANVVAAAIGEASLRAQVAALKDVIKSETDALDILRHQNTAGQIAGAAVAAQEAVLAQTQQQLPPLEKQLAQQGDLLTALAGRLPAEQVEQTFDLSMLTLPENLPAALPAHLVRHRPDVRIAEEQLHTASALVGVAVANRFPNVTLSAGDGTAATTLGQLFQPGNGFWSLGAGLVQPLFAGGTLEHREKAAEAVFDAAAANYRKSVIAAFQQVADVLYALQSDAESLKAAATSEAAAGRSLEIARRQLNAGQIGYLGLLTAQQIYQQALINRVVVQASRYADTAALFQALGGGWWNAPDTLADAATSKLPL